MIYVEDLLKELDKIEPVDLDFDDNLDPAWNVIQDIIDRLPNVYEQNLGDTSVEISTNGDELLFRSELDCERVADALDEHVFGFRECHTGYYDPEEDKRSGETDENTGWFYIDWD